MKEKSNRRFQYVDRRMYLENVNGPEDIKKIPKEELQVLADETRQAVIHRISNVGGHSGPNLGMVEMTVALHYVFDSPKGNGGAVDTTLFDSLVDLIDNNEKAVILNAGVPMGLGFVEAKRAEYVKRGQFMDVGIAEENAVAMCSGIAKNGGTPVFGTMAPFFQRTYDQMSHDLCLNDNPATMLVLNPGVYGMNSNTHIALCDIQMFAHIPNFIYLAPTTKEEYLQMFKFATTQREHPVGIRVPGRFVFTGEEDTTDYSIYNKNNVVEKGSKVASVAVGVMMPMAVD